MEIPQGRTRHPAPSGDELQGTQQLMLSALRSGSSGPVTMSAKYTSPVGMCMWLIYLLPHCHSRKGSVDYGADTLPAGIRRRAGLARLSVRTSIAPTAQLPEVAPALGIAISHRIQLSFRHATIPFPIVCESLSTVCGCPPTTVGWECERSAVLSRILNYADKYRTESLRRVWV